MEGNVKRRRAGLRRLVRSTEGLSSIEYILILALVAVAGIAGWRSFGAKVREKMGTATETIGEQNLHEGR